MLWCLLVMNYISDAIQFCRRSKASQTLTEPVVNIRENPEMLTVNGFNLLDEISDDVRISQNLNLKLIAGFNALRRVGDDVVIDYNDSLVSVGSSFENLRYLSDSGQGWTDFICGITMPCVPMKRMHLQIEWGCQAIVANCETIVVNRMHAACAAVMRLTRRSVVTRQSRDMLPGSVRAKRSEHTCDTSGTPTRLEQISADSD